MRVLVPREAEDGRRTAALLAERGHEALLLPLQSARPLDPPSPEGPFAGFLVTSGHAAEWLARHHGGSDRPVLAVGEHTAGRLKTLGFADVRAGTGRAADLARDAAALDGHGRSLLYAAGRVRLPDLEESLMRSGVPFRVAEVYDMVERMPDAAEMRAVLGASPPDAVLLLSRRQAELFQELADREPFLLPPATRHLCLSPAIAARLRAGRVVESVDWPDLGALLDRLAIPPHGEAGRDAARSS